jgi:hypothetical protein
MSHHQRHNSGERPALGPASDEAAARLSEVLARAVRDPEVQDKELRGAVSGFVRTLKAHGRPPEQVLVALKGYVSQAIEPRPTGEAERALMSRSVEWCIAEYYRAD